MDDLRRALAAAKGEAVHTCLAALDEPDVSVHTDWVDLDQVPTSNLLAIYRRRASHIEDVGLPAVRLWEAVQHLEQTPHETLRLAGVEGAKRYASCVVFLAPDEPLLLLPSPRSDP